MVEYIVKGLRVENTLLQYCKGHNGDFTKYLDDGKKYIFLLEKDKKLFELSLYEREDECGSGWTTATFGIAKLKPVKHFAGKTHSYPETKITLDYSENKLDDTENELFEYSTFGGDIYYPRGCVIVDLTKYQVSPRYKEKRPVWIYYGDSGLGKSYLSNEFDKYETDVSDKLPDIIYESIIVLGNKYKFTTDDIKKRIFHADNCDIILVNFAYDSEMNKLKDKIKELELEILHYEYKPPEQDDNPNVGNGFKKAQEEFNSLKS